MRQSQPIKRFPANLPVEVANDLLEQSRKEYRSQNQIVIDALIEYFKAHSNDPEYIPPVVTSTGFTNEREKNIEDMTESELRAKANQMNMSYEELCEMRDEMVKEQQL